MNTQFIVKLNVLLLALIAVIYSIHKLHSNGLSDTTAAVLGLRNDTTTLNWCDTRVVALERPFRPALRQEGNRWLWESDPKLELNFVAVEKWFAHNCSAGIERLAPGVFNQAEARPIMVVNFVKGPAETLFAMSGGIYRWRREIFKSEMLTKALVDLDSLPEQGGRTTH